MFNPKPFPTTDPVPVPDPVPVLVPDPVPAVIFSINNAGLTSLDFYCRLVHASFKDDYAQSKKRLCLPILT